MHQFSIQYSNWNIRKCEIKWEFVGLFIFGFWCELWKFGKTKLVTIKKNTVLNVYVYILISEEFYFCLCIVIFFPIVIYNFCSSPIETCSKLSWRDVLKKKYLRTWCMCKHKTDVVSDYNPSTSFKSKSRKTNTAQIVLSAGKYDQNAKMIKKKKIRCYAKKGIRCCKKVAFVRFYSGFPLIFFFFSHWAKRKKKGAKEKSRIKDLFNVPFQVASKYLLWLKMQKLFVDTVALPEPINFDWCIQQQQQKMCVCSFFFPTPSKNILIDEGWRPTLKSRVNFPFLHQVTTNSNKNTQK